MLFVVLTHRAKNSVKHFQVTRKDNGYVFGFNEYATLQDFVNHFANQPLLGSDTGTFTRSAGVRNLTGVQCHLHFSGSQSRNY